MKIISGGQTGVDQAGLFAARAVKLTTGGFIPKGFRTDIGPNPSLKQFNLKETPSTSYIPRTKLNVEYSDYTIILGDINSRGCKLTVHHLNNTHKKYYHVPLWEDKDHGVDLFMLWWYSYFPYKDVTINIAGNRESSYPGIYDWSFEILKEIFTRIKNG